MATLYVQYNATTYQMIGSPQTLPSRWTTPEGATIASFASLPDGALLALGWAPVVYEALPDTEAYYASSVASWDADGQRFVYPAVARDLAVVRASAATAIDAAAAEASARHLTVGACQETRYALKYECARDYLAVLAAGETPTASAACFVTAEAEASGLTALEVAQAIVAAGDAWQVVAVRIEAARLGGKRAVAAATDAAAAIAARDTALATLGAL